MAILIRNRPTRGSRGGPLALPAELGGVYLGAWQSTVVDASLAQVREAITGSATGTLPEGIVLETVDDSLIVAAAKAYTRGINARARTTAALPANTRTVDVLQANANGALAAQDGIALVVGDLLGVFNEVAGENNGVYRVDSLGAAGAPWILRRATEFNETADVARGARVFVEEGTLWRGTNWALDAASVNPTLNTTALTFVEVTGPPSGAAGGQLGGTYPNPTVTLGLAANGMVARTAAATWAARTIAVAGGSAAALSVADGDGVAGAPTFSVDAGLISLAALAMGADLMPYTTADNVWASTALTAAGRALIDDASAAAQRTTLGLVIGTDVQAFDATLLSLAALGTVADRIAYTTALDTWAETPLTAAGRAILDDADAAAQRVTLGLEIGVNVQAFDATLLSLAALGTAADRFPYTTALDTWAEATITAAGRAILDDADAAAQRTTLGLVIGTNVQAFDATLLSLAGLGTVADRIAYTTALDTWAETPLTAAGRALIDDADAAAQRTTLGLVIGTNVQAFDAGLLSLAALPTVADRFAYSTALDTWAEATITAAGRAILDDADAAAQRTTLGLVIGTNVQAWDADLDAIAALGNGMVARTGAGTAAARTVTAGIGCVVTDGDGVAGNPTIASRDQQDLRLLLAVDSQLAGNVIGAATETAHTALTMPTANINEARRTIRFKALLAVDSDNGADTWQVRVRIGGLAGTLIADSGAINIVAGEDLWIEGIIQIRTAGAGGTFQSQVLVTGEGAWPTARTYTSAGAINTTIDRDLAITGTSSTASAAQQVTLRYFEAEIYDA